MRARLLTGARQIGWRRGCLVLATAALCGGPASARAQTLLQRTPNLSGGWTGDAGILHFNFLHRFNQSGAPQRQVTSRPTFLLAAGVTPSLLLGAHYATRSDVVARMPNEWEVFGRYAVLRQERTGLLDVSVQAGWNAPGRSADGELSVARQAGPVRLLGSVRVLSSGYGGTTRWAVTGGGVVRLTRSLAVAADVGRLTDAADGEEMAWGVALQGVIPASPHSFSLQAVSTNSATLQGASRGTDGVRWGFEFTIPLTLRRYLGGYAAGEPGAEPTAAAAASPDGAPGDTVHARMLNLAYAPDRLEVEAGTIIVWRNDDPVEHTVTAADSAWDSGPIEPRGGTWSRRFDRPGTYAFVCTPHPFMTGVIVVRERR